MGCGSCARRMPRGTVQFTSGTNGVETSMSGLMLGSRAWVSWVRLVGGSWGVPRVVGNGIRPMRVMLDEWCFSGACSSDLEGCLLEGLVLFLFSPCSFPPALLLLVGLTDVVLETYYTNGEIFRTDLLASSSVC